MFRTDYHIHSRFSDGQPDYKEIIDKAKRMELDCIAITDHFDRYDENKRISSITDNELLDHFERIRGYACKTGQKVLCGIETCTDFYGKLRLSDKVYYACEIIITSPHYVEYSGELTPGNYYDEKYWDKYKEKVINIAGGEGDILGHCEGYLPYGRLLVPGTTTYHERQAIARGIAERFFDAEYVRRLINALASSGKAAELHCATNTPRESVIGELAENGIHMSLGSDAHVLTAAGDTQWGMEMLKKYNAEHLQFIKKL